MVPVEEDRVRIGAGRRRDPVEEGGDLRLADPDDVDAADDDATPVLLEHDGGGLEPEAAVAGRVARLAHEADQRQVERRVEGEACCPCEKLAAHPAGTPATRDGCSSGVAGSLGTSPRATQPSDSSHGSASGKSRSASRTPVSTRIRSTLGSNSDGSPTLL